VGKNRFGFVSKAFSTGLLQDNQSKQCELLKKTISVQESYKKPQPQIDTNPSQKLRKLFCRESLRLDNPQRFIRRLEKNVQTLRVK
jgi:hypothetical protein